MINKALLERLYVDKKMSVKQIAKELGYSTNKVIYWMDKHGVARRTIRDAVYNWHNPNGDPFRINNFEIDQNSLLFGLGIGLYWGEGTKASSSSVRLGNSDPNLINAFIKFLTDIYSVDKSKLKFGLQLFTDIDKNIAKNYWISQLNIDDSQFYKVHITQSGKLGSYKHKSKYGVITIYYNNVKLRNILVDLVTNKTY